MRQLSEKLGCDAVPDADSDRHEDEFQGVVDLITMKALYFDGSNGEKVREEAIPAELVEEAETARQHDARIAVHVQRRADGADAERRSESPRS